MAEKLNKLQLRAKILEIIKSYKSEDDFHSNFHLDNIGELRKLNEADFIVEFLLKELTSAQGMELDAVKYIISDFTTLEKVEDAIWNLVRDKNIPDKKKEVYLQLLRNLGGKIDTNELMECFENFDDVVDNQTLELLELATVNPEAQIDFLDFLTSLNPSEQVQLIRSLQDDFQGDEIANVVAPCLRIKLSHDVKSAVISILADSKSYFSVNPLKSFLEMSVDDDLKKDALRALNQLKTDGVEIDNENILTLREKEVCKASVFYKAYLSQVDGCGNQGLIFSRIDSNKQVSMFSTVINASSGVIDCFGLQNIPITDFQKVITRFKANDVVVPISSGQAKFLLTKAEKNNNETSNYLPYEYICWSIYTADIEVENIDFNSLITDEINEFSTDIYTKLYDTEIFDSWFFEYDDNYAVQQLIDYVLTLVNEDISVIYENVENKIEEIWMNVFNAEKTSEYADMLRHAALVFFLNCSNDIANIAVNIANNISADKKFLKDVIRRSILQYLATLVAGDNNEEDNMFASKKSQKTVISEADAFALLNALEEKWDKADV